MKVPILQSKYFVASAAIAISSKLNDTYRQPDKIALQACQLKSSLVIDEQSEMFWRWRDQLLYREELMLKVLNFELNIEVPYAIKERLDKTNQLNLDAEVPSETSLKAVISLIEVLSSLPILVSYEMSTLFAALLIMITCKAKEKLPTGYLKDNLNVEIEDAWNCYKYVLTLLGYCSGEIESNKLGVKRVDVIERDDFVSIDGVGIENT